MCLPKKESRRVNKQKEIKTIGKKIEILPVQNVRDTEK